jgi:hypothetical protein
VDGIEDVLASAGMPDAAAFRHDAMQRETAMSKFPARLRRTRFLLSVIGSAALAATAADARESRSFKTPDAAAAALVEAARTNDDRDILSVLGPEGAQIVSSGDPADDKTIRNQFVSAYDAKHQMTKESEQKAILVIGKEDFPFPIPLVRVGESWKFDTAAGRQEILSRRIGRNELDAIQASLAYYDAQYEYAEKDRSGAGVRAYAQRIVSHPGRKDGLYWPASQGDESPLGELVANAANDGYHVGAGARPFHGYYYKVLTRQGPAAKGGEVDYVVRGQMIGGFALVAWPAAYGVSGVMTFVVNHNGVVYQNDLGPRTSRAAERMTSFDPGSGWETVRVTVPPASEQ